MPLDFQIQQTPFRFGLAEGTDPHQVPLGVLTTLENGVWKAAGRIEKRLGTVALPEMGGTEGRRLFTRGDELCLVANGYLYAYSPAREAWQEAGAVPDVGATWTTLIDPSTGIAASDVAISAAGLSVHAWITGDPQSGDLGELRAQIRDASTGAVLHTTGELIDAAFGVRVLVIGTTAILLTRTLAASPFAIRAYTISLTTFATSAGTDLQTDVEMLSGFAGWDACVIGDNFVIAYNRTGATVALESYTPALASVASGSVVDALGCTMVSVAGDAANALHIAYVQDDIPPKPRCATNDPATLAPVYPAVTVEATAAGSSIFRVGVCRYDGGTAIVQYDLATSAGVNRMTTVAVNSGVLDATTRRDTYWVTPVSRPFMLGTRCYAVVSAIADSAVSSDFGAVNSALVEVEIEPHALTAVPHRYVSAVEFILGGFWPRSAPLTSAATVGESAYLTTPFQADATATLSAAAFRQGARLQRFAIGAERPADMWRSVATPAETYFVAGHLAAYDGRSVFDYGFFRDPWPVTLTTSGVGGFVLAGTYLYSAVNEYRSAAGILHRSPAMVATAQITSGATSINSLAVASCSLSAKENVSLGFGNSNNSPQVAAVYRTTVGGSIPQRLSMDPTFNTCSASTAVSSSSVADNKADSDITGGVASITPLGGRPALYTTGGILDDYQPPASVTMFAHADRLWCLAGDLKTWWYSKAFQDDLGVAPGFNAQLRISFAEPQTCGASMDDKAIFFSASGISYLLGLGPAPNGQNSDFGPPMKIQTDVGCVNPRSVVSTPDGIMFESARGLYLLTRGLELVWVGRDVKDTLATYPNITSAVLVAKHNQVRFTANDAAASFGIVLVFDYVAKQWSTSRYSNASTQGLPIGDACIWQGEWTFTDTAGAVYQESSTTYLDVGTEYVPMTLATAWIAAAGPIAFQSVRNFCLQGTSYTDHDLTVEVGFDGESAYPQAVTFPAESDVTSVGVEECEVSIGTRRKCSYIRFRISDSEPSTGTLGTGRGPAFDMMGIEVGIKRGFGNIPAAKKG